MCNVVDFLLKNATDSIQLGFEDYFSIEQDNRRIISSIRNLHAGILLFLKWIIKKNTPECSNALIMKNYKLKIDGKNVLAIPQNGKTIGREEIIDRLKIVGINLTENHKLSLVKIGKIRNDIEHHFSNHPEQELKNSILDAFWILKDFREKYHNVSNQDFFGKDLYNKLISLEINYHKQKDICYSKWVKLDFQKIEPRLPEKILDLELNPELEKIIRFENITDEDEIDFYASAILFFSSISCPNCKSGLVEPIETDFSSKLKIEMRCTTCNETFMLRDIIEDYLEGYYAYEIMKAGAKSGIFPLGRCPDCKLGTFLNYDDVCIYCGNKNPNPTDHDFEYELQIRNVNIYSDKW